MLELTNLNWNSKASTKVRSAYSALVSDLSRPLPVMAVCIEYRRYEKAITHQNKVKPADQTVLIF